MALSDSILILFQILAILPIILGIISYLKKEQVRVIWEKLKSRKNQILHIIYAIILFIFALVLLSVALFSYFSEESFSLNFWPLGQQIQGGEIHCSYLECYREITKNNSVLALYSDSSIDFLLPKKNSKLIVYSSRSLFSTDLILNFNEYKLQPTFDKSILQDDGRYLTTIPLNLDENQSRTPYFLYLNFILPEENIKIYKIEITAVKEKNIFFIGFLIVYSIFALLLGHYLLKKSKRINYFETILQKAEDSDEYFGLRLEKKIIEGRLAELKKLSQHGKISKEFEKKIKIESNQKLVKVKRKLEKIKFSLYDE